MKRLPPFLAVFLSALAAASAADGETSAALAESAHVSLAPGIACVEEFFPPPAGGAAEARAIRLHPAPGGGRPASVAVYGARTEVPVRSVRADGGDWIVELASPLSLKMGFSVAYEAEGFSWTARYDLARDMHGAVRIASPLGRALPNAKVRLAGPASPERATPARGGLLALREDTPLNAEWFRAYRAPAAGEAAWETTVAGDLLPAGGDIDFWSAPVAGGVENEYRFPAAATAKLPAGRTARAVRVVRLSNDERNGAGGVLPAGVATLAGGRETGRTDWTPPGGTMEIALDGESDEVTLEKLPRVPDEPLPEGRRRMRFSYVLRNKSPAAAVVEVHLLPATPFPWELESAPAELETVREGEELVTRGRIPPGREERLSYAIACSVPQALRLFE